jgi:uncharacterized protein YbjT (DUF2867 family)
VHIVVAGASGRTGRKIVDEAVAAGHRVTALVRGGAGTAGSTAVGVQVAEVVTDTSLALPAGADAVISALGMRGGRGAPVCEPGTANLVAAMSRAGITRIVTVSAVPAHASGRGEPWWFRGVRTLVRRRMPQVYDDIEGMERVLRASGPECRWTVVRPGYLTDGEPTDYRLLAERNATTSTHRVDLAHATVALAADDGAEQRSYGIRRGRTRRVATGA